MKQPQPKVTYVLRKLMDTMFNVTISNPRQLEAIRNVKGVSYVRPDDGVRENTYTIWVDPLYDSDEVYKAIQDACEEAIKPAPQVKDEELTDAINMIRLMMLLDEIKRELDEEDDDIDSW